MESINSIINTGLEKNMKYSFTEEENFKSLKGRDLKIHKTRAEALKNWAWADEDGRKNNHKEEYLLSNGDLIILEGLLWSTRGKQIFSCFGYFEKGVEQIKKLKICQKNIKAEAETEIGWLEVSIKGIENSLRLQGKTSCS